MLRKHIIPPLLGVLVCILLIVMFGKTPVAALQSLFADSFTSAYYFGNMLNTAAFFMIAGTGSALAIKSGNMNLGGEGQVYLGGYIGCLVLVRSTLPPPLTCVLALLAAAAGGAVMAALSALLKELRGAAVLLTTFLVSAATLPVIDGLITVQNTNTNMLALPYIADCYKLPHILPPSPLSISFFAAILIALGTWYVMFKTRYGRKMQLWGAAPEFARYCGYSSRENTYLTLCASGALHSLTGFFAVTGTYFTCHKGFYVNMGWNALNVALLSSSNPLAVIPTSLVLAWIFTSASRVSLTQGFDFDIAGIVQGVILFSVALPFAFSRRTRKTAREEKN